MTENGVLTHKMCCICLVLTPVEDLWRDSRGKVWDVCSVACAKKAGLMAQQKPCGCQEDTATEKVGEAGLWRCWNCNKVFST